MIVKNAWYIAATSAEIGYRLFPRTIAGEIMVMFRGMDGSVAALRDRCPHKSLPLSHGAIVQGNLQCGYHGLTFAADGSCVAAPTCSQIPSKAKVQSYPVIERDGLVWIWPGDKELADEKSFPDLSEAGISLAVHEDKDFHSRRGYKRVMGHYGLMIDNLMDLSHVGFVHDTTLGTPEIGAQFGPHKVEKIGKVLVDRRVAKNVVPPPTFKSFAPPGMDRVDFWIETYFLAPSITLLVTAIAPPGTPREDAIEAQGYNILTPETERSSHYFYGITGKISGPMGKTMTDLFMDASEIAFDEDLVIIEAQQKAIDDFDERRDQMVVLEGDRAAVLARKMIGALEAAESA